MDKMQKFEEAAIKRYYGDSGVVDLLIGVVALIVSLGVYFKISYFGAIALIAMLAKDYQFCEMLSHNGGQR